MKRLLVKGITVAMLGAALALPLAAPAFAATPTTGQPGQSCQAEPSSPGNASSSPGAPFNETAPGQADTVYAGNPGTASLEHANSTAAVSQYDVACFQVSQH